MRYNIHCKKTITIKKRGIDMISDVVKYGVVGTGYFGAELARAMKGNKGAKIVAVFDPENGETIANE